MPWLEVSTGIKNVKRSAEWVLEVVLVSFSASFEMPSPSLTMDVFYSHAEKLVSVPWYLLINDWVVSPPSLHYSFP